MRETEEEHERITRVIGKRHKSKALMMMMMMMMTMLMVMMKMMMIIIRMMMMMMMIIIIVPLETAPCPSTRPNGARRK
jgi:hypothetical protein